VYKEDMTQNYDPGRRTSSSPQTILSVTVRYKLWQNSQITIRISN